MKNFLSLIVAIGLTITFANAQTSSTAKELASKMTVGWNIGNSLEVPDGETAWGNPLVSQTLIDAVSAAGFNTIRIPCAWDSYADETTHEIDSDWLARVKEVIDYCYENDMYVILNAHWDGGWLEENPTYDSQDEVNEKQDAYWTQIAEYFNDYDEHLLFAGTNEVHYDYNDPSDENIEVQESYNQTFVDAVRATGGNNATRVLVVQTYNTNAWYGLSYFTLPTDDVDNKLIVEIHYYDPYNFTLNSDNSSACIVWGSPWSDGDVCSWGQEDYVDDLFDRVEAEWIDNDIPVIIGEYGVINRNDLTGDDLTDHTESREYYLEYITSAAVESNIIPIYWDNGAEDKGMALFDRSSGDVVDEGALNAVITGAGIDDDDTNDAPSAAFSVSATSGTAPLTITFDASSSSDSDGDDLSFSWDLGDGSTSTGETTSYTYETAGSYTATLTVSDGSLSSTASTTITVKESDDTTSNEAPSAAFSVSATSGTAPLTITLDASSSSDPEGDDLSFSWDLGDGSTSTGETTSYTYETAGSYTVTLTVSDGSLSSTASTTITVNDDDVNTEFCDDPTSISIPFSYDGAGEYCWVTTQEISYVNSWGLDELTINGEDYTNVWSSSLPDAVDGQWTIHYSGSYSWSHFEAPETKSTGFANSDFEVKLYPNPFNESIQIDIDSPNLVNQIAIRDVMGRLVYSYNKTAIGDNMVIGEELNSGMYIIQIYSDNQVKSFSITKE